MSRWPFRGGNIQDIPQRTVNYLAVLPGSSVYELLDIAVLSGIDC